MIKKIMVVDDEPAVTRMLRRNLEATGRFEVLELNDPTLALIEARSFLPDLVFLDFMMPNKDGGEVAAEFKEDPTLASTPVVFLTAIVTKNEVKPTGSVIGENLFLAKPFRLEDLLACIDNLGKSTG